MSLNVGLTWFCLTGTLPSWKETTRAIKERVNGCVLARYFESKKENIEQAAVDDCKYNSENTAYIFANFFI